MEYIVSTNRTGLRHDNASVGPSTPKTSPTKRLSPFARGSHHVALISARSWTYSTSRTDETLTISQLAKRADLSPYVHSLLRARGRSPKRHAIRGRARTLKPECQLVLCTLPCDAIGMSLALLKQFSRDFARISKCVTKGKTQRRSSFSRAALARHGRWSLSPARVRSGRASNTASVLAESLRAQS